MDYYLVLRLCKWEIIQKIIDTTFKYSELPIDFKIPKNTMGIGFAPIFDTIEEAQKFKALKDDGAKIYVFSELTNKPN